MVHWSASGRFYFDEYGSSVRFTESEEVGEPFRHPGIKVSAVLGVALADIHSEQNTAVGKGNAYFVLNFVFLCQFIHPLCRA